MAATLRRWTPLLLILLILAGGCARSPEAKKARYLDRGDRYFRKEQYREAILEYRNALRIEATNARAMQQLGLAHYHLGEVGQSVRFLLKARELDPGSAEVHLKLGTIYLLGRRPAQARDEAQAVLTRESGNVDALILLGSAATTEAEVNAAIRGLEAARRESGGSARLHVALARLHLRLRDLPAAERLLGEAVALEPRSIEAHTAMAELFLLRRDLAGAEREFRLAADIAPSGSAARLRLADFYLLALRPEEARRVLTESTEKAPDYLPAWRRLAELAVAESRFEDAEKTLDGLLKKSPRDLDGRFLRGRVYLAKRETTQALQDFQEVLKLEPRLAPARYYLALAHLQAGNVAQAKADLKEASATAPNYVEAVLRLAQLNLQSNAPDVAIEDLEKLVAREPRLVEAHVLLGGAYLAKRDPLRATAAFRKIVEIAPNDPRGPYYVGQGLLAQGKRPEGRKELEAALDRAPGYVDPAALLVRLDFAEKRPDAALARVQKQVERAPRSGALQHLLGRVHEARHNLPAAEAAYARAIELQPELMPAYRDLARLFGAAGRYDPALERLDQALKRNPRDLGALMLAGVIQQQKGDIKRAQDMLGRALEVNPRFAPAANNLAYLLSEHGGDQERALQLAQVAKEVAPEEPHVSDTLGWILYKRGVYQRAVTLLQESAQKLPDNPSVKYHLGATALKLGNKEVARKALVEATSSAQPFPERSEAKKALDELR